MSKSIIQKKRILTKAGGGGSLATPVSVANGGTGLSSYAIGDIIYASGATTLSKLAIGTANQQLRVNAGATALEYFTPSSGGITVGTTTITSGTTLRIPYNLAGVYQEQANFTIGAVASGYLDVPTGYALAGHVLLKEVNTTSLVIGNTSGTSMTGAGNTVLGYQNGVITSGTNNTYIGATATTRSNNNAASYNTTLGYGIDINSTTGYNVVVGALSGLAMTGYYNIALGVVAGASGLSGTGNIMIGAYAGELSTASISNSICIGANSFSTASGQVVLGGANSHGVNGTITDIFLNNPTSTSPTSVTIHASSGIGTNVAAANITINGGNATGSAVGGNFKVTTSVKGASGTTLQTSGDRVAVISKYVDLTGGVATTFANLALATSSTISGGVIVYTVEANDGTDFQSLSGSAPYSVVNKAGTLTYVLGTDTQSSACSTGTLTGTLSLAAASTTLAFQMNAVSSLSETVLRVSFQVLNNMGVATITAA